MSLITHAFEKTMFDRLAPRGIHYVRAVPRTAATGLVAAVYRQMEQEFQVVPPLTVHSGIPELLAGVWMAARETLIAGPADRAAREIVALAVSKANACPFCVDAHAVMLHGANAANVADAIEADALQTIPDLRQRTLAAWALASRQAEAPILSAPPFSPADAPQFIGTAVLFHYINRLVNVFLDDSPLPIPPRFTRLRQWGRRAGATMFGRRIVGIQAAPGHSLTLLPAAPLPENLLWAASNSAVAGAFARLAAALDHCGAQFILPQVRALVAHHVTAWRGEDLGLSRQWVEEAVRPLEVHAQPAGRLALLVALASYQVDDQVVAAFRAAQPEDEALLATVAWASWVSARRVGSWLRRMPQAGCVVFGAADPCASMQTRLNRDE